MKIGRREVLIWLNSLSIGNNNVSKLLKQLSNIEELWQVDSSIINSLQGISKEIKEKLILNRNNGYIYKVLNDIEKNHVNVATIYDKNYPPSLKDIDENPKVLYFKGDLQIENNISMAVVGSRKATSYGKWACEKFTKELVDMDITIISGLALGIDSIAHKVAVESGGRTIGVLGNGIDNVYPKKNLALYNEVIQNGSIISEFPLGTPPLAFNFPQRNRIISGLSLGIIVIEAQEKSGSLITAHHGLEQGKDVFALPGNINSVFSGGTNKLIRDGAKPLLDIEDIIEEIHVLKERLVKKKKEETDYSAYSETEIKIIKMLEEEPAHIDAIAYKTNTDIVTLNSILTILELKGKIKELSSRIFTIC